MKRLCVVLAGVWLFQGTAMAQDLQWERISRENDKVFCALVRGSELYCGTARQLIRSVDQGKTWTLSGVKGPVYDLEKNSGALYAVSAHGVYRSDDGVDWRRISRVTGNRIAVAGDRLFLACERGLMSSPDSGKTWVFESAEIGYPVSAMAVSDAGSLCVVSARGVFRRDTEGSWMKAESFTAGQEDLPEVPPEEPGEEQTGVVSPAAALLWFSDGTQKKFLMSCNNQFLISADDGRSWQSAYPAQEGLGDVTGLAAQDGRLFATAGNSVFEYDGATWRETVTGLGSGIMHEFAVSPGAQGEAVLYAASDSGFYRTAMVGHAWPDRVSARDAAFDGEPPIEDVFREAIRYAEVSPEKITDWRRMAGRKAWLPQFSVGLDRDTTDLWHWEGGSTTRSGDDELCRGKDTVNWDVSLTWDLSELVWTSDQTSIDVRSRLMVELRDDVLDQVTRIYFERLRVKHELETLSLEQRDKRFETELKVRELTASLDALTGGYFSKHARSL